MSARPTSDSQCALTWPRTGTFVQNQVTALRRRRLVVLAHHRRPETDFPLFQGAIANTLLPPALGRLEQLSIVVDEMVKDHQAATLSFVVVSSSSVTLMPSLNVAPSSSSLTSSAPLSIRQRSCAASSSL